MPQGTPVGNGRSNAHNTREKTPWKATTKRSINETQQSARETDCRQHKVKRMTETGTQTHDATCSRRNDGAEAMTAKGMTENLAHAKHAQMEHSGSTSQSNDKYKFGSPNVER